MTSLFLASVREGEGNTHTQRWRTGGEREAGECEGEIKEACFLSTQLLSAAAVTSLNPRLALSSSLRHSSPLPSLLALLSDSRSGLSAKSEQNAKV